MEKFFRERKKSKPCLQSPASKVSASVPIRPLADYEAYRDALGAKKAEWSSTGQFLAVGSYDQAGVAL